MIDRYFVFGEDKFEPHIDYSRTRGLVSEIVNEIDGVEEEIRLAQAAELVPPPDHVPRAPIGAYRSPEFEVEETFVIGPNGIESTEVVEPDAVESIPPTAADEQEGGSAPPPATDEPPHGAEPETPIEQEPPTDPEESVTSDGPDEAIEPEEPALPTSQETASPEE